MKRVIYDVEQIESWLNEPKSFREIDRKLKKAEGSTLSWLKRNKYNIGLTPKKFKITKKRD